MRKLTLQTANEAPPSEKIPFHHEMAQVPNYPRNIFFYCSNPPATLGQTPLVSSIVVARRLRAELPSFMESLDTAGVVYTRILPAKNDPLSPIGRSWSSTFASSDPNECEKTAANLGILKTN